MSGLGWPGRGRRGAHGGAPSGGLGWPSRKPSLPPGTVRVVEQPQAREALRPEGERAAEPATVTGSPADTPASVPSAEAAATAPSPEAPPDLPAVLPPELRTGPDAPVAPVVLVAPVEAVQPTDPLPVSAAAPAADEPSSPPEADPAEPAPAGHLTDPAAARMRAVLRDQEPTASSFSTDDDLPIGAQAAAAVRALNPHGRYDFPRPASLRVITVANQKGGVGKTTSTVNLAAALALHGAKVLVIDLDPQGNCSTGLGVAHHSGTPNVYDVLIDEVPIAEVVQPADGVANLWCVPATIDLAGAEIELVSVVARESRLQRAIEAYCAGPGADLDYVLVDCPPSLGLLTVNAMVATRELLIPIQCEYYALEGLGQLLKNVELVRQHLNTSLHVSTILLTMYDARTRLADQVAEEVRSHFGDTVLATAIPRSVRVSEAPGYGQSVVTYDPGSRGALAYVEAAREIAERGAAPAAGSGT
jgi:chromosome partitioning protein